jgi:hypothetical protein
VVLSAVAAAAAASRMTEYIIDPAKGTAQLRRVSTQQQTTAAVSCNHCLRTEYAQHMAAATQARLQHFCVGMLVASTMLR